MDVEMTIFTIITHSGDARSSSMEAITHAKEGEFEQAQRCIEEAENKLSMAHKEQTKLIQAEAQGEKHDISLLLIHAQDHLMNAMTIKDMANEFVELYISINA
ncbi:PTS lactose/cellobiose transporter subunit IIA [Maledivibacter halophilus]|uniref:PTS system, cellobiose-specific IIA component n=1 Tax=Maledivibacter halophilus TaxID=36842 RepID=A0A1T5IEH5_9FIRM|nr:PTS lactose/cellobiose transporter subunit IIA [Maledivibacter halophilus]SKC37422.1 PTS system, cellobiose-specific IIA component [Maledivibacter halophilus]